ncbi:unnamed protein product [Rhizophagus irregularis]|uniref:MYND-type domain-containing protein n=1 Tax=Rhizophagus irregularis TaxID=588596 RepID=A0A2I1GI35_9GLOM|nr:hypothetical protein RhiirA4_519330 [Rhizophagus irregularis]CAB4437599.1 unnamed protein product [Rhizophagus irregularis]CAB4437672.1 unnamed protein product [Rhizophagus irregularis]
MDKCYVCKKLTKTHCAKCQKTHYCSKECQKKDWKEHKKSCNNKLPVVKINEIIDESDDKIIDESDDEEITEFIRESDDDDDEDDDDFTELLFNLMLLKHPELLINLMYRKHLEGSKVPDFGKEYATKYPNETKRLQLLNRSRSLIIENQDVDKYLNLNVNGELFHTLKRWNEYSKELIKFISSPRKIGDIFTEKVKKSFDEFGGKYAQSFSNTPKQSMTFDQGKVHVAVGFVDLDFLLRARIVKTMNSVNEPNKFIGYEGSIYAVAKTNVIKEMMIGKAPIRSIIEVWFSSVWTKKTLKCFEDAVNKVLKYKDAPNNGPPNPTKNELHPKVRSLISHWSKSVKSPKSRQEAHKLWAEAFDSGDSIFYLVTNLVEPRDRIQATRHILTGEFPLMDDQQQKNLIASITMFNCNNGISPHSTSEFMFEMMPTDPILSGNNRKITPFLKAIYNFLEDSITKICNWLSPPARKTESIEIYLHYQSVNNDNPALHASIRQLDPWIMSWSNICDFFNVHDFHKLLRACSGENTVHLVISMNWITETYGAHIMDYNVELRRKIYAKGQNIISMSKIISDMAGYFRYDKITTHPYNIADIGAKILVEDKWKNHFFKGQDMKVGKLSLVPFSHTHKIHTYLDMYFTYNKKINAYTNYC